MQRINHRGNRRYNRPKFDRNIKKYKSDVQPDQLTENDVGITEYLTDLGFSGILKARFSDFQVNEIDENGEIAKFTNTKEPEGFDQDSLNKDIIIPTETPCDDIPQEIWTEILAAVDSNEDKLVELDSTNFNKEQRTNIHNTVKRILQKKIIASTIMKDDKKYLTFKKYNKDDKHDKRLKWPLDKEEYVHFLVYKENIDTLEAVFKISDCLRMTASCFNYAGVKDRRGKTTQWFSVRKVHPWKLLKHTKCLRNIHIGNITFKDKPLKLGGLLANRFRIALRNITADDDLINKAMKNLNEKGFINYYGLQRFGNDKEVPTYEIGIKLLLGQFKEACNLILKCKKCENPDTDISRAKKVYSETGSASSAAKLLREKEGKSLESKLLQGLAKSNMNDYVNALENVPRNTRLLYIHAFQSLVWNQIVSRRIKEYGLSPVVGDLVLLKDNDITLENDDVEVNENGDDCSKSNENDEEKDKAKYKRKNVKILTEDDLENYTIYDIVLPMPGYDITYPENAVKDWCKDVLEGYGLSLEMPRQSVRTYTLSGTYRHIVAKVTKLSWKIVHYNDPNDDLIRSDFDEFLNKPEPVDQPDGQYKALIMDFCLNSSCYATMVVREILKTDTSTSVHTKLNDYHIKKERPKIITECKTIDSSLGQSSPTKAIVEPETIDAQTPNSLLSDPSKYEDFKKSIFGSPTGDDSLKRNSDYENEEAAVPEKKSKKNHNDDESVMKMESTPL